MESEKKLIIKELSTKKTRLFFKKNFTCLMKNSKSSQNLRKKGNQIYLRVKSDDALKLEENFKLYSESIRCAECDSEDLAFAYGNRSALLHRMKKYREAVSDIDKALRTHCSDAHQLKLLKRKIDCFKLLNLLPEDFEEVDSTVNENGEKLEEENISEQISSMKEKLKNLQLLDNFDNKEVPEHQKKLLQKEKENFYDSVSVKYNEKYGRHLVANQDFEAGQIIFVENPFVKVINLNNVHMYCSYCFKTSWSTIPCNYCNWCMFCSEECKKKAWNEYHDMECSIISHLLTNVKCDQSIRRNYQMLTVRMLIMSIKKFESINKLKEELEAIDKSKDKCLRGLQKDNGLQVSGLSSIYTLNDDVSEAHLQHHKTDCIITLIFILKFSQLFKNFTTFDSVDDLLNNDDVLYVGSLLLKLYKISDKNSQQIPGENYENCKYSNDDHTCHLKCCCSRGSAILIINSFINHSCDPNVKNAITSSQHFIVYSLEPIKKDSQIFTTYLTTFYNIGKTKRQIMLKTGYNFECDCSACKNEWPTAEELWEVAWKRPRIYHKYMSPMESEFMFVEDQLVRSIMTSSNFECSQETVETLSKALRNAFNNVKQPSLALWKLKSSIQRVFEKLYSNL